MLARLPRKGRGGEWSRQEASREIAGVKRSFKKRKAGKKIMKTLRQHRCRTKRRFRDGLFVDRCLTRF